MPIFLVIRQIVERFFINSLKPVLAFFVILVILGTFGAYLAEHSVNPGFQNLWDSFWWTLVTVATVGYGDKVPVTVAGRVIGIICIIGGPFLLASSIGSIGIAWYNWRTKGERGMNQVKSRNHLVICGWNEKAAHIVREVRSSKELKQIPIVLIDNRIETKPLNDPEVFFVRGNATEMNTLQQANITEARYAVVLSEGNTPEADQKTVLTILAIEKSNPSIISSAELNDANNASHLQRAGCDVIVNSADLASKLLAMSLLNASVTQVVTDLITGEGNELYRCALPPRYVSKTFSELIAICKQSHDMVLIGIEREGKCLLNPASGMVAVPGDQLLVIAAEQPVLE